MLSSFVTVRCRGEKEDVNNFLSFENPEDYFNHRTYRWESERPDCLDDGLWEGTAIFEFRGLPPAKLLRLSHEFPKSTFRANIELEGNLADWFDIDSLRTFLEQRDGLAPPEMSGSETVKAKLTFGRLQIKETIKIGERLGYKSVIEGTLRNLDDLRQRLLILETD